jgi:hypothetical protein
MDDIGTELADLGTKAGTFFEKDLPDFFTDLGTKIANTFSGGGNSGAVSVPEVPPLPSYTAPPAPSFTAPAAPSFTAPAAPSFTAPAAPSFTAPAAPSFTAPSVPSFAAPDVGAGGGGDFDIGKFFTTDLEAYANTALSWVEANPATFTLWVLVIVVLILACVGIGMAASMPTAISGTAAPPPPVVQPPAPPVSLPFTVDTSGNVTFPGNVTYAGNATVKGGLAVAGQSTLSGLTLSQQFTVQSLTVNDTLSAGNITATGSLTSNANTNLGGTTNLSGALNGDENSSITVGSVTGTDYVKYGESYVVSHGDSITIQPDGINAQLGVIPSDLGDNWSTTLWSTPDHRSKVSTVYNTTLRIY